MLWLLRQLSSLKLTLLGMVLLGIGALLRYGNPIVFPIWVLVIPLAFLAVNISCAIITNRHINRQPGLLLFHVSLLSIVILAGVGRLTHLDAHVEIAEGQIFSPDMMFEVRQGPLHMGDIEQVDFRQGSYIVGYAPNLRRQYTHSKVFVAGPDGKGIAHDVGDDRPLILNNFRFYTTANRGFAPILTWIPTTGEAITGRIHMPSYPLFEYKQDNKWTPPGTDQVIKFWLQLDVGLTRDKAWVMNAGKGKGVLVVNAGGKREELTLGDEVQLDHGRLRFVDLTSWIGYRIFYDPTIFLMVWITFFGVLGLAHYFWSKMNKKNWLEEEDMSSQERDSNAAELKTESV